MSFKEAVRRRVSTRDVGTFLEYLQIRPFYSNDLLCELIADIAETKQISGIEVIKQAKEGAAGTYSDNDIDE